MNKAIIDEIDNITSKATDGLLHEEEVVKRARNKNNPLHMHFNWNDRKAAHEHRLDQARDLIRRVKMVYQPRKDVLIPVRQYVSLASDRLNGGGYRRMGDVLDDAELRSELLRTAIAELNTFKKRYQHLAELCDVMDSIDDANQQAQTSKGKKRARA